MPIDRKRYPRNWRTISHHIRFIRAGGKCEQCGAKHGEVHLKTGARVQLHTAHLDHNTFNCADENLLCLCHVCHLQHDRRDNWRKRKTGPTGQFYKQLIIFHED